MWPRSRRTAFPSSESPRALRCIPACSRFPRRRLPTSSSPSYEVSFGWVPPKFSTWTRKPIARENGGSGSSPLRRPSSSRSSCPPVLRRIGTRNVTVVATPSKLVATPVLRVDTGDPSLDEEFRSREYLFVLVGYRTSKLHPVQR